MRCDARQYARLARHGPATAVSVRPTGTAVEQYQVPLGNRHSLREAGVIGLPSWSEKATQNETWVKVPRLSATCPRRVIAFDGGKSAAIDRVMEFGDDFDGAAIDAAKWTTTVPSGGECSVSSSKVTLRGNGEWSTTSINCIFSFIHNIAIRFRATIQNTSNVNGRGTVIEMSSTNTTRHMIQNYGGSSNGSIGAVMYYGTSADTNIDNLDNIYDIKCYWNSSRSCTTGAIKNNVYMLNSPLTHTNQSYDQPYLPVFPKLSCMGATPYMLIIEWVCIHKCAVNEPLTGTAQPSATNRALSRPLSAARAMQMAVAG